MQLKTAVDFDTFSVSFEKRVCTKEDWKWYTFLKTELSNLSFLFVHILIIDI